MNKIKEIIVETNNPGKIKGNMRVCYQKCIKNILPKEFNIPSPKETEKF